jgi:hypothetical protein
MTRVSVRWVEQRSVLAPARQSAEQLVAGTVPGSVHWPAAPLVRSLEQ